MCLFSSCKVMMIRAMYKDPKVETPLSINSFQAENNFPTSNTFFLAGDTSTVVKNLVKGLSRGYRVFDKNGLPLCYQGTETCSGIQFRQLLANNGDSFSYCSNKEPLSKLLSGVRDSVGNAVQLDQFPPSDFYVFLYWQKFQGGARSYKDGVQWMEQEIANVKGNKSFTLIKVNADLQASWGLTEGREVDLKIKRNRDGMTLDFGDIPTH